MTDRIIKVSIVGDSQSGKTSLCNAIFGEQLAIRPTRTTRTRKLTYNRITFHIKEGNISTCKDSDIVIVVIANNMLSNIQQILKTSKQQQPDAIFIGFINFKSFKTFNHVHTFKIGTDHDLFDNFTIMKCCDLSLRPPPREFQNMLYNCIVTRNDERVK